MERQQLLFGQNTSSSCIVQVAKSDLKVKVNNNIVVQGDNCQCLKRIIFNKLNDYFVPSNFVSKNGNPNMDIFNSSDWLNVYPSKRILSSQSTSDSNLSSIYACLDVPYKINVWFLYTEAGKSNGSAFYEIVGTYVR